MNDVNFLSNSAGFSSDHRLMRIFEGSVCMDAICGAIHTYTKVLMYTDPEYDVRGNEFDMYLQICKYIGTDGSNPDPITNKIEIIGSSASELYSYLKNDSPDTKFSNIIKRYEKQMTPDFAKEVVLHFIDMHDIHNMKCKEPSQIIMPDIHNMERKEPSQINTLFRNIFKADNRPAEKRVSDVLSDLLEKKLPCMMKDSFIKNEEVMEELASKMEKFIEDSEKTIQESMSYEFLPWSRIKKKVSKNKNLKKQINNIAQALNFINSKLDEDSNHRMKYIYLLYELETLLHPIRNFYFQEGDREIDENLEWEWGEYPFKSMLVKEMVHTYYEFEDEFLEAFGTYIDPPPLYTTSSRDQLFIRLIENSSFLFKKTEDVYDAIYEKTLLHLIDSAGDENCLRDDNFWETISNHHPIKLFFDKPILESYPGSNPNRSTPIHFMLEKIMNTFNVFENENLEYLKRLLQLYGCKVEMQSQENSFKDPRFYEPLVERVQKEKKIRIDRWIRRKGMNFKFDFNFPYNIGNRKEKDLKPCMYPCLLREGWNRRKEIKELNRWCDDSKLIDRICQLGKEESNMDNKVSNSISTLESIRCEIVYHLCLIECGFLDGIDIRMFFDNYCLHWDSKFKALRCYDDRCKKDRRKKCCNYFLKGLREQWMNALRERTGGGENGSDSNQENNDEAPDYILEEVEHERVKKEFLDSVYSEIGKKTYIL